MIRRYGSTTRSLGLALFIALALIGCEKGCGKQEVGLQKASLELIPADSNVVIGMNWKKIEVSPLGAKLKAGMPKEAELVLQNVEGVIMGGSFKGVNKDSADFVAIINGKVDPTVLLAQITEEAKKDGLNVTTEDYEGIKIYGLPKDEKFGVAFLGAQAIAGSKPGIKKTIDLFKKKGDSLEKNKDLIALISGVDKNKMIWAVGAIPPGMIPASDPSGNPNSPMGALAGLKAVDLSLDFLDNLVIDLGIITGGKDNAQQLMTMANSYKTLFGTSLAMKDATLGKVLNGLTIDAKDERVNLNLKIDRATVEELAKKAAEKQPGPGPDAAPVQGQAPKAPAVPVPPPG